MHTEVEPARAADANIDFFVRRFTAWAGAIGKGAGAAFQGSVIANSRAVYFDRAPTPKWQITGIWKLTA
jgi:hypothetical protein